MDALDFYMIYRCTSYLKVIGGTYAEDRIVEGGSQETLKLSTLEFLQIDT